MKIQSQASAMPLTRPSGLHTLLRRYEEGLKDPDKKFLQRCFGSEFFNWCYDRIMSVRWYNVPKHIWMNYSSELAIMVQTV